MIAAYTTIDKIIDSPTKPFTQKSATEMLRSCGILDKNSNIKPAYKEILSKENKSKK